MVEEGSAKSALLRVLSIGYKCCLLFGVAVLLLAYKDVTLREHELVREVSVLRDKIQEDHAARRQKRSLGLDGIFGSLQQRLDSLERRLNRTDAFTKLGHSPFAALLPFLRGPPGRPGKPGEKGDRGRIGFRGLPGKMGPKGDKGEHYDHQPGSTGSVSYVRWGKSSCPKTNGTELVYSGWAAGQEHQHTGGMSNTLCLHTDPTFAKYADSTETSQYIYGVEYQISAWNPFSKSLHDKDAVCSVCRVKSRGTKVMIPGRNICPSGWTVEYKGYLMSPHYGHKGRSTALCVDEEPEGRPGGYEDKNGNLWYFIQASCGSLPCGPYVQGRELTCVVCSK